MVEHINRYDRFARNVRHEILNEFDYEVIYEDIYNWLKNNTDKCGNK